jgi:hypothetical protein
MSLTVSVRRPASDLDPSDTDLARPSHGWAGSAVTGVAPRFSGGHGARRSPHRS